MAKFYAGQRWAFLEVVSVEREYIEVKDGAITEKGIYPVVTLNCNCGNQIKLRTIDIPNQHEMKDCGCGKGADFEMPQRGRPKSSEPKQLTSLYIEIALRERAKEYGDRNNLTVGRAMCELIALGLATVE